MIDTLRKLQPKAKMPDNLTVDGNYALVTLHRPSNVDDVPTLTRILSALNDISSKLQIVFPIHPRTRSRVDALPENPLQSDRIVITEPTGYLESLALQQNATLVITDSGGLQEESTCLGIPCLTVRENTERPVTSTHGTNTLVGTDMDLLRQEVDKVLSGSGKAGEIPPLWDGNASERITDVVLAE